ncbi:ATP-grasp domain-containing protein [Kitasatospora sp. NPDC059463]|uniref:ATP-grasp domain-containing protein n=1 Tax=unclassified Kitasatospora TaxID=2633591 RepID=UPI0036A85821
MTTPRILLLEAAGPESGALAVTAVAAGYQVHAATDPETHATYATDLQALLSGCLLTDFSRTEQALRDVIDYAHHHGVGAVLTTNEYLTELLAHVCAALGLPGNDPARAAAARSKAAMSEAFARHGVTAPRSRAVGTEDELLALCSARQVTFPCVMKPAGAASSAGVTVVTSPGEAAEAFQAAKVPRGMYGMDLDPRVLVQEFIEGTEYSVESITQNGMSTHLCVTRKTVTGGAHRVELGHALPAVLSPEAEQTVIKEVDLAIAAVGIRNGASHTEVMLASDGRCTVIEIGARVGAGQIGFLIQHALGIDPWAACLETALGRPANLAPTRSGYATVRFLTSPHPGRLATVTGLPDPSPRVPIVRVRKAVGQTVNGATDNTARLGSFVVVGPNQQSVDLYAEQLFDQIRIDVEPGDWPGSHSTTTET